MSITITLHGHRIPSQNQTSRMHWRAVRKLRKDEGWHVTAAKLALPKGTPLPPSGQHVNVTVQSYRSRLLDFGNLVGGAKGLIDALVAAGLATDDKPSMMTATYQQITVPRKDERTVITITWAD
jgi:hypothetical protein